MDCVQDYRGRKLLSKNVFVFFFWTSMQSFRIFFEWKNCNYFSFFKVLVIFSICCNSPQGVGKWEINLLPFKPLCCLCLILDSLLCACECWQPLFFLLLLITAEWLHIKPESDLINISGPLLTYIQKRLLYPATMNCL